MADPEQLKRRKIKNPGNQVDHTGFMEDPKKPAFAFASPAPASAKKAIRITDSHGQGALTIFGLYCHKALKHC